MHALEYVVASELRRLWIASGKKISFNDALEKAREKLRIFTTGINWLAALAEDGSVFNHEEPEDAQLSQAVVRLGSRALLLTRDKKLLEECPQAISPEKYLLLEPADPPVAFVDLAAQQDVIRPSLERNIHAVLQHGRYIMGPEIKTLESKLAEFSGADHCVSVASGTDALLMSLMALDIGPGDLVLTTPFTFIATAEIISLLGATPVFVDIDERTYNIDPEKITLALKAIQSGDNEIYPLPVSVRENSSSFTVKAIIPVDLFGLPADYDAIMPLAEKYNLFVLSDSAQGFGSVYKGRPSGSLAHATTTSFFPAKPLGCYGDGGAVFTDDDEFADKLASIRVHGKGQDKYDNIHIGLNARLDTLQAAILLPKLEIFPSELERRQQVAKCYTKGLMACRDLQLPCIPEGYRSAWAQYSIVAKDREKIQNGLKNAGIPNAVYYGRSLHQQLAFQSLGYKEGDMPISERISRSIFSVPMHPYLVNDMIDNIAKVIIQSTDESKRF